MTIYLMDFLGGARFQKTALQSQPRKFGFGVFAEVDGFGKAYDLIAQMGNLNLPLYRTHLMWKDLHNFNDSDIKEVARRAKILAPIYKDLPNYRAVSPCCEHELNPVQFERFADAVMSAMPSGVVLVNSPNGKGKGHRSNKYLNEFHGDDSRAKAGDGFSFDGTNCVDSDVESFKNKDFLYLGVWNSQCNGRRNAADKTPRAKRKFWPTEKQIDSWVWLFTHKRAAFKLPKEFIAKSHSDQHTVPPMGKDQKPVYITPMTLDPSRLQFRLLNGQVLATSTVKKPYNKKRPDGTVGEQIGWRYYFDTAWGFEHSEKAIRMQGNSQVQLFGDNRKIGLVDPAFRGGTFR